MKVAIAGYGLEGEASYQYWSQDSSNQIMIVDQHHPNRQLPEGVITLFGEDAFSNLNGFDMVIRTPSLAPSDIKTDGKIWSATNEFFEKCKAPIIGVTGTKGKGTTASLIASMFEEAGKRVWLVGNIGTPALGVLDEIEPSDIVIFELSSFQLWDLERSPHTAVVLLIEADHLDVHADMSDYVGAKKNIRLHQGADDICIYHPTNSYSSEVAFSSNVNTPQKYNTDENNGSYVRDGMFYYGDEEVCPVDALQLIGAHNIENATAAIAVAKIHSLSNESIRLGLEGFKGLPHRLEYVRTVGGVDYYNDSFSSATPATVAAIKSFDRPQILILGGVDRGVDMSNLQKALAENTNVKQLLLIGAVKHKMYDLFNNLRPGLDVEMLDDVNMIGIVDIARSRAEAGDVVLLSPGSASFDMFKDFYDRGDQFKHAVGDLSE